MSTLQSWEDSANAAHCDFPIQNLPYGVFSNAASSQPRVGVAIGEQILDLAVLADAGLLRAPGAGPDTFVSATLNAFIALGPAAWASARAQLTTLLEAGNASLRDDAALRARALVPQAGAHMHLPLQIPGYTDFYSSKEHATNVGAMFRDPDNALLPELEGNSNRL